ncbi:MAG: hypothetical protein AB4040_12665 [Synechococcus sp.]
MLSILSNLISPKQSGWSAVIANPLKEIENFYVHSTELPLKKRRIIAKERLRQLKGFTPHLAKTIVKQWDDAHPELIKQKRRPKSRRRKALNSSQIDSFDSFETEWDDDISIEHDSIPHIQLGQALQQAGLIGVHQIEVALMDAQYRSDLRIGEILALRGWIQQETADFFAEQLIDIATATQKERIGQYLKAAKLLTQQQIDLVLDRQLNGSFRKFGETAVSMNYIKQQTLDFLLTYIS